MAKRWILITTTYGKLSQMGLRDQWVDDKDLFKTKQAALNAIELYHKDSAARIDVVRIDIPKEIVQ